MTVNSIGSFAFEVVYNLILAGLFCAVPFLMSWVHKETNPRTWFVARWIGWCWFIVMAICTFTVIICTCILLDRIQLP